MLGAINISYSNSSAEEKSSETGRLLWNQEANLDRILNKSPKWQYICNPAEQRMNETPIKIHAEPWSQTILTSGRSNKLLFFYLAVAGQNDWDDLETKRGDEFTYRFPISEWTERDSWQLDVAGRPLRRYSWLLLYLEHAAFRKSQISELFHNITSQESLD